MITDAIIWFCIGGSAATLVIWVMDLVIGRPRAKDDDDINWDI